MVKKQTDEELLREADWAEKHIPDDAVPISMPDEFERIWQRIQDGEGDEY